MSRSVRIPWSVVALEGDKIVFDFGDGTYTDFSAYSMLQVLKAAQLTPDDVRAIVRDEIEKRIPRATMGTAPVMASSDFRIDPSFVRDFMPPKPKGPDDEEPPFMGLEP